MPGRSSLLRHAFAGIGAAALSVILLATWALLHTLLRSAELRAESRDAIDLLVIALRTYGLLAGAPILLISIALRIAWNAPGARSLIAGHAAAASAVVTVIFWMGIRADSDLGSLPLAFLAAVAIGLGIRRWILSRSLPPARRLSGAALALLAVAGAALLAAAGLGGATGAQEGFPAGVDRPSILLLVADTLRADHVGAYGYGKARTPHLDGLARSGAIFDPAYASASWTGPATASILTGLHPSTHGFMTYQNRIRGDAASVAGIFSLAGYRTAGFAANPIVSPRFGFGEGFDLWDADLEPDPLARHAEAPLALTLQRLGLWKRPEIFPRADRVVDRALGWLDRVPDKPFFLYLHFMDPHDPYAPPAEFDEAAGESAASDLTMQFGTLQAIAQGRRAAGPADLERMIQLYDGAISYMDQEIGRLLDQLARRGLRDRTIVLFTSDHGEEFNEHDGLGHEHSLHEELVRLPFIVAGPGIPAGRALWGPARQIDVAPTLLEAAGLPAPARIDGASLWGSMARGELLERRDVLMEESFIGIRGPWHAFRAIRRGDLKLTGRAFNPGGGWTWEWALHDLALDPGERFEIAAERPAESSELRAGLEAWAGRDLPEPGEESPVDEETLRKLKALGYVQ